MDKKLIDKAMELVQRRDMTVRQKANALAGIVGAVGGTAIALLLVVVVAIVVANFQTTIGTNQSNPAWIIANNTLGMLVNFSNQLGLAGTILGFVVVFGGIGLLGYFGYQYAQSRSR